MIINAFGGNGGNAAVGNANAFLSATDSQGVYTNLYLPTFGVGAMLASICIQEGCATTSTSGLSTLMGLNTYAEVLANSTAFNIVNKSAYIWTRVYLDETARTAWQNALPSTYTLSTTTFTKVADSDFIYNLYDSSATSTTSVPSGKLVQFARTSNSSGSNYGSGMGANFILNSLWPRGYSYYTVNTTASTSVSSLSWRVLMIPFAITPGTYTDANLGISNLMDFRIAFSVTGISTTATDYTSSMSLNKGTSATALVALNTMPLRLGASMALYHYRSGYGGITYTVNSLTLKKTSS